MGGAQQREHAPLSRPMSGLRPQDLVITILGANGRTSAHPIWSGGMVRLLSEFGFSIAAARVALGRLARSGLLTRAKRGRRIFYELTPQLVNLLEEGDRQIFGLGHEREWSGQWTVLWQAVPDELGVERRRLVRRLRFLGFGSVQNATWISPHDRGEEVRKVLADLGVGAYVGVIVGRPATEDAVQTLTRQAWDLDALDEHYVRFLDDVAPYRSARRRRQMQDAETFIVRVQLVHRFRRFPSEDPGLPDEPLSRDGNRRREAIAAFREVYNALGPAAQRHFDAAMQIDALVRGARDAA